MKTTPFWTEDFPHPPDFPLSTLSSQVDVAVIGGGYTGLNAALALRAAGASVAVLEQHTMGWGASSRNGGMATAGLKLDMPVVFRRYGAERGRAFWAWALASIDHVERMVRTHGLECDFGRTGHVLLAAKPRHLQAFHESAAWHRAQLHYQTLHVVGPAELRDEIGCQGYFGGLVDPTSAAVHPAKYVFGLARAAGLAGAQLVEQAEVKALRRQPGRFELHTARGVLKATEVLLATNGYTTSLVPAARRGLFPGGSYIITTEPLPPDLQAELSPKGRMFFDSKHFLNYFRLTPDGRMLFGGRHNLSPTLDLAQSAEQLRRRMIEVFPQLTGTALSHSWTGQLGLTFDLMPHLGRVDGVHYAYGYSGHGLSVASYLGWEAGEIIAGVRRGSLFGEIPHARYPFTPYDRLYLPLVSAWFRLLDVVE